MVKDNKHAEDPNWQVAGWGDPCGSSSGDSGHDLRGGKEDGASRALSFTDKTVGLAGGGRGAGTANGICDDRGGGCLT